MSGIGAHTVASKEGQEKFLPEFNFTSLACISRFSLEWIVPSTACSFLKQRVHEVPVPNHHYCHGRYMHTCMWVAGFLYTRWFPLLLAAELEAPSVNMKSSQFLFLQSSTIYNLNHVLCNKLFCLHRVIARNWYLYFAAFSFGIANVHTFPKTADILYISWTLC